MVRLKQSVKFFQSDFEFAPSTHSLGLVGSNFPQWLFQAAFTRQKIFSCSVDANCCFSIC